MRFSEALSIQRGSEDDWFDPLLNVDTRLFIDPFRIFVDDDAFWGNAHAQLIDFFNLVLELVAKSGGQRTSPHWRAAARLLIFPEPVEFSLGYAESSPIGAGAGRGLQQGMLEGALTGVELGIQAVEHFEELTLFEAGIGADRISDIVCNVLKAHFIKYTQRVADRHGLEPEAVWVRHANWSREHVRWEDHRINLPPNQFTRRGVLLTPERFLRELPTVDPYEFWEWSWSNANEEIRGEFNYEIARNLDAQTIARFARLNPHLAKRYVSHLEESPKAPYDVDKDPAGEVKWWEHGAGFAQRIPLAFIPSVSGEFCDFVEEILGAFTHNIEEQDGWLLLWNNGRPRAERIVQALFRSTVIHYCRANNIDLAGEANAGRGPVDFKFSQGWDARALVEVKLTNNSKFWSGLKRQLVQYLKSEGADCAYFLSVGFSDADFTKERQDLVKKAAAKVSGAADRDIRVVFVDARRKPSASKL